MRVALAVPCFVDQLRPQAARATLTLLERLGCTVSLDFDAPCCGQPMFNSGLVPQSRAASEAWVQASAKFDAIVMPSGSCTMHVRKHVTGVLAADAHTAAFAHSASTPSVEAAAHAARVTYELCEFIAGPLGLSTIEGRFPYRVVQHLGCHAQRGLRLGGASELHQGHSGPMHTLLSGLEGISLVDLDRPDECCGFGGSFAVGEAEVSTAMGRDKLSDVSRHDAGVLVSSDPSCLMHLESVAAHQRLSLRTMHIAELLEEATR